MTIRRLRPAHPPERLHEIYAEQYDHTQWPDHVQRVRTTIDCIHAWTTRSQRRVVADLSCGDAAIARGLDDAACLILGDYVHNDEYAFTGSIEHTVKLIGSVGLFILSETLEHVDDPVSLLIAIRQRAGYLVLSTPLDERDDQNEEHYWGWDEEGIRDLLFLSGWSVRARTLFTPKVDELYYTYQIWGASSV